MIQISFTFDGNVQIRLIGNNDEDKQLLGLVFNGKEVKTIRPVPDGIILEMVKSEDKSKV